jgi:hypothetical protein
MLARSARARGRPGPHVFPDAALSERLIRIGLVVAVAAVAVQTAAHLTNEIFFESRFDPLSADVDWSIFSWASSAATFAVAVAALVLAVALPERRRPFTLLASILVFFSLDDIAQAHENVAGALVNVLDSPAYVGRFLWELVYAPVLLLAFVLLWRAGREAETRARDALRGGLALLAAAVVAEGTTTVWFAAGGTRGSWPHVFEVTLEEAAELAGWIMISAGLLATAALALLDLGRRHACTADAASEQRAA